MDFRIRTKHHQSMTTVGTPETIRFPIRRDLRRHSRFGPVVPTFYALASAGVLIYAAISGTLLGHRIDRSFTPDLLLLAVGLSAVGTVGVVWIVRRRPADGYALTQTEIVADEGYRQFRAPLAEVQSIYPVAIRPLRDMGKVDEAIQVLFTERITSRAAVNVFPAEPERFLDELAARCPHLVREGSRFFMKPSEPGV